MSGNLKKTRLIPNLSDMKNRRLFRAMNLALIIGEVSLILTFFYLIINFVRADKIILIYLPRLVFGLVLMILHAIDRQRLITKQG